MFYTTRAKYYTDEECSDCGDPYCVVKHAGALVPPRKEGVFCDRCFALRDLAWRRKHQPRPLGYRKVRKKTLVGA